MPITRGRAPWRGILSAMAMPAQPQPQPHEARAAARKPARAWFWGFTAVQAFGALNLVAAGTAQTWVTTFAILGSWASADVIIAITFAAWRATSPNPGRRRGGW